MHFIPIEEAQARLTELIAGLVPGESISITKDDQTIATLVAEAPRCLEPRVPGSAIGILTIIEDDDAHLEDFRDYMP